jgi:hypothetical protein
MFIERRVNSKGVVELWNCNWENSESKDAKKNYINKICDEKQAETDADGGLSEIAAICWANGRTMGNIAVVSPDLLGHFPDQHGTNAMLPCDFVEAGKFRHGAIRMWCRTHQTHWGIKADLKAYRDSKEMKCAHHSQPMNYIVSPYILDITKYAEVGVWCSMPAAVSTHKIKPREPKIHVHVREKAGDIKILDKDFPAISIFYGKGVGLFANDEITRVNLTPPAAFEYVKGLETKKEMDCINCISCGYPHLDMGDFAKTPHRKHFCGNCGKDSTWSKKPIVSTPLQPLHDKFTKTLKYITPSRTLNLDEYAGKSYSVWASTPAIVWTAERPQEFGIHVHVHEGNERIIDDTFGEVILDGKPLKRDELVKVMIKRTIV